MPEPSPVRWEPLDLALDLAACADWKKADHPLVLDLRGLSSITDFFVITSSISQIGVRAISDALIHRLRKHHGLKPTHIEGLDAREWVCIDAIDVVVHVFLEPTRAYFDLESLWADAPRVRVPETLVRRFAAADS